MLFLMDVYSVALFVTFYMIIGGFGSGEWPIIGYFGDYSLGTAVTE